HSSLPFRRLSVILGAPPDLPSSFVTEMLGLSTLGKPLKVSPHALKTNSPSFSMGFGNVQTLTVPSIPLVMTVPLEPYTLVTVATRLGPTGTCPRKTPSKAPVATSQPRSEPSLLTDKICLPDMRIARRLPNTQRVADMPLRHVLAELRTPLCARREAIDADLEAWMAHRDALEAKRPSNPKDWSVEDAKACIDGIRASTRSCTAMACAHASTTLSRSASAAKTGGKGGPHERQAPEGEDAGEHRAVGPGLFRVRFADGTLSDAMGLTEAREALTKEGSGK